MLYVLIASLIITIGVFFLFRSHENDAGEKLKQAAGILALGTIVLVVLACVVVWLVQTGRPQFVTVLMLGMLAAFFVSGMRLKTIGGMTLMGRGMLYFLWLCVIVTCMAACGVVFEQLSVSGGA